MNIATTTQTQTSSAQGVRAIALATLIFGCAVVFLTGFANSATIHSAAHDTRHALGFPCH